MNNLTLTKSEVYSETNLEELKKTLGTKQAAQAFLAELWNVVSEKDSQILNCEKETIISGALQVARLGLSFSRSLGQAALVPYAGKAQLQIMYKGLIQLALRTGKFKKMGVVEIYQSEFKRWNKLEEELEILDKKTADNTIVGYYAFFETIDGFKKCDYWDIEKVKNHAEKFSKTVNLKDGVWNKHFDAMAKKTALKSLIRTYGLLDMSLIHAMEVDQAVVENEKIIYVDNPLRESEKIKPLAIEELE